MSFVIIMRRSQEPEKNCSQMARGDCTEGIFGINIFVWYYFLYEVNMLSYSYA